MAVSCGLELPWRESPAVKNASSDLIEYELAMGSRRIPKDQRSQRVDLRLRSFLLLVTAAMPFVLHGQPSPDTRQAVEVLEKYVESRRAQETALRDVSMDVEIEANLPRLNKQGRLRALRYISRVGAITYQVLNFIGDNLIKRDVIARYMSAEVKAAESLKPKEVSITPENYKFKYRGVHGSGDWRLMLYEVEPRKKRVGLFEGWLWVETTTGLPVRESGRFVKNPSIFLRKVEFMRDYHIRDGIAYPVQIESTIDTRLVGLTHLTIKFSNFRNGTPSDKKAMASLPAGRP